MPNKETRRLAELIAKAKSNMQGREFSSGLERNFFLAEQLIDNGVILPPCKVGDTVYFPNESYHMAAEIDGIYIDEQGVHFSWVQYDVGVEITELWDEGEFDIEEIGKTVFLTFEEFEKALTEKRADND